MLGREEVGDDGVDKPGRGRRQSNWGLGVGTTMGRLESDQVSDSFGLGFFFFFFIYCSAKRRRFALIIYKKKKAKRRCFTIGSFGARLGSGSGSAR